MADTRHMNEAKTLPDGRPNPLFYEELVAAVNEIVPVGHLKEQTVEYCMDCKQLGHAMYDYKKRTWYMECACEIPVKISRETKNKTLIAWNVVQIIKELEADGDLLEL